MGSELFVLKVSDPLFQHFGETESVFFTFFYLFELDLEQVPKHC
jgi:hypothetical protein